MKLRILTLIIACLILLTACNTPDPADTSDTSEATESSVEDTVEEGYLKIQCRSVERFKLHFFSFDGSKNAMKLSLPDGWNLTKKGGGYSITREGEQIGNIVKGEVGDDQWKAVKTENNKWDSVAVKYFVEKNTDGGTDAYRHRLIYSYDEDGKTCVMTLTANYEELDAFGYQKVFNSVTVDSINKPATMTDLSHLLYANGSPNFLILGNSFIGTSNIGAILNEMFHVNGKNVSVTAKSIGMATVATHLNDNETMAQIRHGDYAAVFICGFYGNQMIDSLGTLKAACDQSNTKLVVFPAHNEQAIVASTAAAAYDSVELLNWKGELDALIASGIDRWDLCVDDQYDHSLPVAGYVGAHMIYRGLFGEMPKNNVSDSISFDTVKAVLGDYVETAEMANIDVSSIKYIK